MHRDDRVPQARRSDYDTLRRGVAKTPVVRCDWGACIFSACALEPLADFLATQRARLVERDWPMTGRPTNFGLRTRGANGDSEDGRYLITARTPPFASNI